MDNIHWSSTKLRKYIDVEGNLSWFSDESGREREREDYASQLRMHVVPAIAKNLLERIGVMTDAEGLVFVAAELTLELRYRDHVRRWLLVCAEPWDYLTRWLTEEIAKSYRLTAGKGRPSDKVLKEIERANQ